MRRFSIILTRFARLRIGLAIAGFAVTGLLVKASPARAGAWLMPEGQGQVIAGFGSIDAARTFDAHGRPVSTAPFRKWQAAAYLEYGLADWLTVVAAPSFAHMRGGVPATSFAGSDESAFGVRVPLYRDSRRVFSVQGLVEPQIGTAGGGQAQATLGGPNRWAGDVRLQYGETFGFFGRAAFFEFDPGVRFRGAGWADEGHADVTFGIRPWRGTLVLLQMFTVSIDRQGPRAPAAASSTVELSVVHEIASEWSLQVGALMTIAGRNAAREIGPIVTVWTRF